METQLFITNDGSHSLFIPELDETYHSRHGAIQESLYIYIEQGLNKIPKREITILEIGFGTGLNVLLTAQNANGKKIHYTTLEPYPLPQTIWSQLNYPFPLLAPIHEAPWETECEIQAQFILKKHQIGLENHIIPSPVDLIYFDAFAPSIVPDLWTKAHFRTLYEKLLPGGILVTFSAKGSVRRDLEEAGFAVTRLKGPPGKKRMTRAAKVC